MPTTPERALAHAEQHLPDTIEALKVLSRIPSVSANPPPSPEVDKSAEAVAAWMKRIGLEKVEILRLPKAHPYVYGEHVHVPGAPTALLYAHHDVQPIGRESHWKSPPFEPEERNGRLYGRGVVDDKAGAAVHFAALDAYLKNGGLPLNIKMIVEGEEEIGSDHLGDFLEKYKERLQADVIVLTDTANLASGLPSITYALRGIAIVDLEVEALDHPLHSGMWGGPVPDVSIAMCKILGGLFAADGKIAVPGIYDEVRPLGDGDRERLAALPFDEQEFRRDAGIVEGARLAGETGYSPYEQLWHRPSLTIHAMEAAPIAGSSNQILSSARARIGIRTVPDMNGRDAAELLCKHLQSNVPWNVRVKTSIKSVGGWWITDPKGPAFEAAERALERGYAKKSCYIAAGGSIPFVEPFARVLGGVPALLIGLEDPICNAHSENESLLISDFKKAIASAVWLYDELSRLPKR
jgi:acetylornithine deacetylase/succinyl-diaminopimelate desuccinylase-like protein